MNRGSFKPCVPLPWRTTIVRRGPRIVSPAAAEARNTDSLVPPTIFTWYLRQVLVNLRWQIGSCYPWISEVCGQGQSTKRVCAMGVTYG